MDCWFQHGNVATTVVGFCMDGLLRVKNVMEPVVCIARKALACRARWGALRAAWVAAVAAAGLRTTLN